MELCSQIDWLSIPQKTISTVRHFEVTEKSKVIMIVSENSQFSTCIFQISKLPAVCRFAKASTPVLLITHEQLRPFKFKMVPSEFCLMERTIKWPAIFTLRIADDSNISAMKVETPFSWLSPAPTRHIILSTTVTEAELQGTKHPICAIRTDMATWNQNNNKYIKYNTDQTVISRLQQSLTDWEESHVGGGGVNQVFWQFEFVKCQQLKFWLYAQYLCHLIIPVVSSM